jgi:hypothetical protein
MIDTTKLTIVLRRFITAATSIYPQTAQAELSAASNSHHASPLIQSWPAYYPTNSSSHASSAAVADVAVAVPTTCQAGMEDTLPVVLQGTAAYAA